MNFIFVLALQNNEEFNVRETVPYSKFVERNGFRKHFNLTKKAVVQEIKRRSPAAKLNANKHSVEQLLGKLQPLESKVDRQYVIQKEAQYRQVFLNKLREEESDKVTYSSTHSPHGPPPFCSSFQ